MTNEEARKILDSSLVWPKMVDEECEALGMAIKALETVERIEARKRELEKKLHSSFLTDPFTAWDVITTITH